MKKLKIDADGHLRCPDCGRPLLCEKLKCDSTGYLEEFSDERKSEATLTSRCHRIAGCNKLWLIFLDNKPSNVTPLHYQCEKCCSLLESTTTGFESLENILPEIQLFKYGIFKDEIIFECRCGHSLEAGSFLKIAHTIPEMKKRAWDYIFSIIDVSATDTYSLAYAALPRTINRDTDLQNYIRYIHEVDFDHCSDDFGSVLEMLNTIEKENMDIYGVLFSNILMNGSQEVDEQMGIEYISRLLTDEQATKAFKETVLQAETPDKERVSAYLREWQKEWKSLSEKINKLLIFTD